MASERAIMHPLLAAGMATSPVRVHRELVIRIAQFCACAPQKRLVAEFKRHGLEYDTRISTKGVLLGPFIRALLEVSYVSALVVAKN